MTKNPVVNAFLAAGYIGLVVLGINFIAQGGADEPDTLLIPMAMLSLFVLSAAVMGYLFVYQPFMLYFEDKKQEAVTFFVTTVGVFALITLALFGALFFLI